MDKLLATFCHDSAGNFDGFNGFGSRLVLLLATSGAVVH